MLDHECPDCAHPHYQPDTGTFDGCWCGCPNGKDDPR